MKIGIYTPNGSKVAAAIGEGLREAKHRVLNRNSSAFTPDQAESMFALVIVEGYRGRCAHVPEVYGKLGVPVISIDLGYMLREQEFQAVGLGQVNQINQDIDPARREHYKVAYKKDYKKKPSLCILGQLADDTSHGMDQIQLRRYYEKIVSEFYTFYPELTIHFRPHPKAEERDLSVTPHNINEKHIDRLKSIDKSLDKYGYVYTINSTSALPALLRGIPVLCGEGAFFEEIAHPHFTDLEELVPPTEEAVNEFFSKLFNSQYTLEEMCSPELAEELIERAEIHHLGDEAPEEELADGTNS